MVFKKIRVYALVIATISIVGIAYPAFRMKNANLGGIFKVTNDIIHVEEVLNLTGKIISSQMLEVLCGTLQGDGLISGETMNITARNFLFTGTIECGKECTIITAEPIDQTKVRLIGEGKYIFIVNPALTMNLSQNS